MPWRILLVCGLGYLLLFLVVQPSSADHRAGRPVYKNPIDLTVNAKGTTARVVLAGTAKVAVVDLHQGKINRDLPLGKWNTAEAPLHAPDQNSLAELTQSVQWEQIDIYRSPVGLSLRAACMIRNEQFKKQGGHPGIGLVVYRYAKTQIPTTQVAQGWVFTHLVTEYSPPFSYAALTYGIRGKTLDEPNRSFADASDVAITPDGRHGFIAFAGSDLVLVIDVSRLRSYRSRPVKTGTRGFQAVFDLTASRHFVVARLRTQANPRRLRMSGDGKTLVVSNYLADSLTVIDVPSLKVRRHIPLGGPKPDPVRRGQILFNSARMTFQGQFTCASCHPDGRSDHLVWDLTRDGIGNFKKTKSLLGVKDTAPYGWHGSSPTLADRVTGTLQTLHRHEPSGTEVADIVAYLQSLPPPRPSPISPKDKPAVDRGRGLFLGKARCATCHRPPTFQDGKLHDIGTRGPTDTQDAFDTPSLRGVSGAFPFLHDGRAPTLEEIFTKHNGAELHGATHKLGRAELEDLLAFLKSL
jgi:cytochrome c peroxidase